MPMDDKTGASMPKPISKNPRDTWPDEAKDFTPWLASPENLAVLAEALNMQLVFEAQEKNVGQFRADILCRNREDNTRVLIENQLEATNHAHLGQLLTYAIGLEAATIVWIATEFTDEHRAALNWLNAMTPERFQFFGVVIAVWQRGESDLMPTFAVVSAPEDWRAPATPTDAHFIVPSTPRQQRKKFWHDFRAYLTEINSPLKPMKMPPRSYLTFSLGIAGLKLSAMQDVKKRHIGVRLYISGPNAAMHFHRLSAQRTEIERELGAPLEWTESFGQNPCRVTLRKEDTDPTDETEWSSQHAWLAEMLERFAEVFKRGVPMRK